ncbi:DUF262 domain-containing protein [Ruegeria arenilitoris]|uniref:DUF262 domain-containing protein n=1 Tax=Ruegeria arenilitoris TaxID=1173585 RepID=UPI00147B3A86|nr:DUF262 domain-containing HNH endonuclease family protein [Ruegeria arenilitoris]
MSVDIESIFKATAQSSWAFLITTGQGCYIPAYQRHFAWSSENVDRLFEDAIHGLHLLQKRDNTISFLGTIIAIHDTKHATVQPIYKTEMPSKVMTIIDGQQRISTFLMINAAISNVTCRLRASFPKKREPAFDWLEEQLQIQEARLKKSLFLDMETGDPDHQHYPRLARAYEDVWSKRESQAKYSSPISRLLWEYFLHLKREPTKIFRYAPKDDNGELLPHYRVVSDIFKHIQKRVNDICIKKHEENDFPELLGVIQNTELCEAIWGFEVPQEVIEFARDGIEEKNYDIFCNALRLILLTKYMSDRMAFTVVTAESEDDAFDMFEALNTTGEPLTAFETFKPKVIEAEGMAKYEKSPSFEYVTQIESYLETFKKAEERQRATSVMLVPFALSETGEKLQKKLADQRRWLRDQFESDVLDKIEDKRGFVRRLSSLSKFLQVVWRRKVDEPLVLRGSNQLLPDTIVGLDVLREIDHSIVAAPLGRFFDVLQTAEDDDVKSRFEDFEAALRSSIAFSVMWRAAIGGTSTTIDTKYRQVLSEKIDGKYGPLAVRPKKHTGSVSISNYKKSLIHFLEKDTIWSKADWVDAVIKQPIYSQKTIARFLLFLASHDAVTDSKEPGLIERGRAGVLPLLTTQHWHDKSYLTLEHIAPQSNSGDWEEEIYADPVTVDSLGNLTLLPGPENSIVGNKKWEHKKALYRILSAKNEEEFKSRKHECSKIGLSISLKAQDVLDNAKYLPMCESLAEKTDTWDADFIETRSKRLAELVWDRLSKWLD